MEVKEWLKYEGSCVYRSEVDFDVCSHPSLSYYTLCAYTKCPIVKELKPPNKWSVVTTALTRADVQVYDSGYFYPRSSCLSRVFHYMMTRKEQEFFGKQIIKLQLINQQYE